MAEKPRSLTHLVEPAYDDYLDVIEGRLEALIFPCPGVAFAWDHAPSVILIAEAGGRFRDPSGGARTDAGSGLFTNGLVDAELDAAISGQFSREHDHHQD
ncbi:MAG TPA: inositol monophosphatase family protein [Ilumatobacter sp.]|nr:inositol monophosphatase family protein [Ilumatobacter sp.]